MSRPTIYIDGQQGSTGLRIRSLLDSREDIDLRLIPEEQRKDASARADFLNGADLAILCLPDEGAAGALELITASDTRVIDTSTARRTHSDWTYGLPELSAAQRQAIRTADRVANPGCYPVGFILAVRPLIEAGLLDADFGLTVHGVSGYSGGGRKMIEAYQKAPPADVASDAPLPLSLYHLTEAHKHLPEMRQFSLSSKLPLFVPSVDHRYSGMLVTTPIPAAAFTSPAVDALRLWEVWDERYGVEPFVDAVHPERATDLMRDGNFLELAGGLANGVELFVFGNAEHGLVLVGRQDNLGKGASGNAVQCVNLMLGFDEATGLAA